MNKLHLRAFTLIELTIALLLFSIVSGFVYYTFNTFFGQSQLRQQQKQERYDLDLFIQLLKTDCAHADHITYLEPSLILNDSLGQITYLFLDSLILRDQYQLRTDSFHIVSDRPHIQLLEKNNTITSLVNQIELTVSVNKQDLPLFLQKTYSAQQILQTLTPHYHVTD